MNNLPVYFNFITPLFPMEVMEILIDLEKSFSLLEYVNHQDDLYQINMEKSEIGAKDLANQVMSIYREHIDSILTLQGIFLKAPFDSSISHIVTIFNCVTTLAITPIHEILAGVDTKSIDNEGTTDTYFAKIINMMSDLDTTLVLSLIETVSDDIRSYIMSDHPILELMNKTSVIAEQRFKKSTIPKKGIVVETIRIMNKFGYSVKTFLLLHSHEISQMLDEDLPENYIDAANEIILMVLGSSTLEEKLLTTMLEVSEHIVDGSSSLLKINTIITKYMRDVK